MNSGRVPRDHWKALLAQQRMANQKPLENQVSTAGNHQATEAAAPQEAERGRILALIWRQRYGALVAAAGLVLLALGLMICRSPVGPQARVPVSGQVLVDGRPLTCGEVRFIPDGARASVGAIDAEGRFTLTCYDGSVGAVPGRHHVEVAPAENLSVSRALWQSLEKYASFETSDVTVEITRPVGDLRIELRGSGVQPVPERK